MATCDTKHQMGEPWCACGWVNWDACEEVQCEWSADSSLVERARASPESLTPVERRVLEQDFAAKNDGSGPETDEAF